ncbi:MAG: DUF1573 domain-containing protein [Alistipes sp.]|nr:DUF1573 domain-containing protein [Alistipes sp.]
MFRAAILVCFLLAAACTSRRASVVSPRRTVVLTDSVLRCGGSDTVRSGRLHSGEVGVSRLWFENRTSRPVVIVSVTRSCGCTSLSYDAAPIRSGEVRAVEVSFDSRGEFGWQFKRIDLFFAGSAQPFRLFAEADVE